MEAKEIIFQAQNVTKTYKKVNALSDVSFNIEKGRIYGFIGENGAGKTTIIRLITGMIVPTKGSIALFGSADDEELAKKRRRVGAMVEKPTIYATFTARENIEVQKKLYGIQDDTLADRLLKAVGLEDTGKKKAKNFSLGMRQRLGIAMALVNNPDFLVLDEPINGLDPVGIYEVRTLLEELNRQGKTILISSHILSELYQLATDYVIISHGKIVETLSQEELDAKCSDYWRIRADKPEKALEIARNMGIECEINGEYVIIKGKVEIEPLARAYMEEKILVTELSQIGGGLENYYMKLIGGEHNA